MRFKKKPVVIEAMRIMNNGDEVAKFLCDNGCKFNLRKEVTGEAPFFEIETLEGIMVAYNGDWIIKGIKGEFYPVKPDIFKATYEPVND